MILSVSKTVSILRLTIVELWLDDSGRVQFVITFLFVGADLYGKWKLMQWLQLCSSRLLLSLTVHIVLILWLTALPRSLSLLSSAIFFEELVLSLREVLVNPFLLCMQDQKTDS